MEQFTLADFDDYWALLPTKDSDVYFVSKSICGCGVNNDDHLFFFVI